VTWRIAHAGIHGTPDPDHVGKTASHGCIRLTNWDALDLASKVDRKTPVEFLEQEAGKPSRAETRNALSG
jgi:lipoprotein-anchoring transpeptidase ErfK/SrfK